MVDRLIDALMTTVLGVVIGGFAGCLFGLFLLRRTGNEFMQGPLPKAGLVAGTILAAIAALWLVLDGPAVN